MTGRFGIVVAEVPAPASRRGGVGRGIVAGGTRLWTAWRAWRDRADRRADLRADLRDGDLLDPRVLRDIGAPSDWCNEARVARAAERTERERWWREAGGGR